jgi:hypothetical protein
MAPAASTYSSAGRRNDGHAGDTRRGPPPRPSRSTRCPSSSTRASAFNGLFTARWKNRTPSVGAHLSDSGGQGGGRWTRSQLPVHLRRVRSILRGHGIHTSVGRTDNARTMSPPSRSLPPSRSRCTTAADSTRERKHDSPWPNTSRSSTTANGFPASTTAPRPKPSPTTKPEQRPPDKHNQGGCLLKGMGRADSAENN